MCLAEGENSPHRIRNLELRNSNLVEQRDAHAEEKGKLKVELAARNLRIMGLEKSLDDAVVALQGILEHPGDEESWKEARKVLPGLLRMLDDGPLELPNRRER
jgi:hypothetical protein